jgi:vanillate/3-O-methylgallate O-demethylase
MACPKAPARPSPVTRTDASRIGTEVIVQWGDYGGRIKDVRATVERFPNLTERRNSDVDVTAIP